MGKQQVKSSRPLSDYLDISPAKPSAPLVRARWDDGGDLVLTIAGIDNRIPRHRAAATLRHHQRAASRHFGSVAARHDAIVAALAVLDGITDAVPAQADPSDAWGAWEDHDD